MGFTELLELTSAGTATIEHVFGYGVNNINSCIFADDGQCQQHITD